MSALFRVGLFALVLGACAHVALGFAPPARSVETIDDEVTEYGVKAMSLWHFIGYTTWPKSAFEKDDSPFVLLVVGEDPFGGVLERTLKGKKAGSRPIRIVRSADLESLPKAHLIFLARSHAKEIGTLMAGAAARGVLVVGDSEGLAVDGAHVCVFLESKRLRFEVNNEAVKRSELTISPEMLKLARIVSDRGKRQDP
jgi:hypothetical protein